MGRKKSSNTKKLFTQFIRTRVDEATFNRLHGMIGSSDCHSIGEIARKILSNEKITVFHKDNSLDQVMNQLAGIHRELNAIGVNINQITRYFHGADTVAKKSFQALKVAEQYTLVGNKVETLNSLITSLASTWLQK